MRIHLETPLGSSNRKTAIFFKLVDYKNAVWHLPTILWSSQYFINIT